MEEKEEGKSVELPVKYLAVGVAVLIAAIGYFLFGRQAPDNISTSQVSQDSQVLKINVEISGRKYNPEQIDVPLGSTVELTVKNNDNEQHGLSISNFGVNGFVGPLQTKTVRFVADQNGKSTTFCSVAHPEKLIINVT